MKAFSLPLVAVLLVAALPVSAELPMAPPLVGASEPTSAPVQSPSAPAPVEAVAAEPPTPAHQPQLAEGEQRIRMGIVMMARLHDLLASVTDEASAEAAVAPVMRTAAEFQTWAQGFSSLPPLEADTQRRYEKRYLPVVEELNTRLKVQGERIASAEFYGSRNLTLALVRLVTSMQ